MSIAVSDLIKQEFADLSLEDKQACPGLSKLMLNRKAVNKKIGRKRNPSCLSDHKAARLKKPKKPKRKKGRD